MRGGVRKRAAHIYNLQRREERHTLTHTLHASHASSRIGSDRGAHLFMFRHL